MVEHEDLDSIQVPVEATKPTTDNEELKLVVTGDVHVSTISSVFFAG